MSQIDLTPWCRAAVGDYTGTRMPRGYRLMGHASPQKSSYRLVLYRDDGGAWAVIAERATGLVADVRPSFDSLVDIAWIDARERDTCDVCGRRPAESNVTLGDKVVGVCGTCYERGREAATYAVG